MLKNMNQGKRTDKQMKKKPTYLLLLSIFIFSHADANAEEQTKPIVYYHEESNTPELKELLESYNYREYISAGKDEFQKMALLKNWVYKNIRYSFSAKDQSLRNSLKILQGAKFGQPFLCTNLSAVFMQSALSLGWTSRYFFLRKPSGPEHATNDIWSNQHGKWVFMDTTWNLHLEKNGIPLSIAEARSEWFKNRGRDLVYVFGAGKERVEYTYINFPVKRRDSRVWSRLPLDRKWLGYLEQVALVGRNNFFTYRNGEGRNIWDHIYIIKDRHNSGDRKWPFRKRKPVKSLDEMFHKLNYAIINIEGWILVRNDKYVVKWSRVINIKLKSWGKNSYTPNFSKFMVSIDEGKWFETNERLKWILKPGMNKLSVRVINSHGVKGPISSLKINN
jgi:hypothetical protein